MLLLRYITVCILSSHELYSGVPDCKHGVSIPHHYHSKRLSIPCQAAIPQQAHLHA